ncbi:MAG: hypothetical protein OEZ48_01350 [Candidatus Bathyarchaeota archaeon]|nr:hypothetical protein [Candidatus Bathyarchaeota archaeon]MDH5686505.1 hypothetical protein [Candidatus Bathyarchaeota archaeon]
MSIEEQLTAKITADVSEAVDGFRQVQNETKRLQTSLSQLAYGLSGVVSASMALYRNYEIVRNAQADTSKSAQDLAGVYAQVAFTTIPAVLTMSYNLVRTYTVLKASLGTATVAQWLYNKALMVTHALSGPAGWAILGIAAAVTAGAVAWASMNRQQEEYNRTIEETRREFRDLQSELSTMSPIERLQRQYQIVREYYGYSVSVGNVNVTAGSLGSPFDRERAAEDVAKQIGHKLALKVITR